MPRFTDTAIAPIAEVTNDRVVDNGDLIFSGGISVEIDRSLSVIAKLLDRDLIETASSTEYDWREPSSTALPSTALH